MGEGALPVDVGLGCVGRDERRLGRYLIPLDGQLDGEPPGRELVILLMTPGSFRYIRTDLEGWVRIFRSANCL